MFGFDEDFGLDDLIEADVMYGIFENDRTLSIDQSLKQTYPHLIKKYGIVEAKIVKLETQLIQLYKNPTANIENSFKIQFDLANLYESKFYLLKEKLENDYEFIINFVENNPHNTDKIEEHVETFCDEYDELEACVSELYETTIFLEAEEEYESEYEHYSEIHFQLESDLADIEDLKFELEMLDY